jgi:protein MpaA
MLSASLANRVYSTDSIYFGHATASKQTSKTMLTLTRSQSVKWAVKTAARVGLLLLVLGAMSACSEKSKNQNSVQQATAESQPLPQSKLEQVKQEQADQLAKIDANDALTNRLLDDHFYQQQTSDTDDDLPQDNKSMVEDLGFSAVEKNPASVTVATQSEPFCLDKQKSRPYSALIQDACRQISERLASVEYSACEAAQLQFTGCSSTNGFPILMSEFAPIEDRKPQGRILIIGGTHGDELTSVSVTMRWIEKLNRYHSGLFHWHLVPLMNPDGVLKRGATRTNGNGVDLNRNMPSDDWQRNAIKYWVEKSNKDPRKNPGKIASSEPETQWLIDEIESFQPDAIISVHAPYGVVDFDSLLLKSAPKSLGKLHLNLLGTYPGSLGNYAGINRNIPVITLELPHSWVMPSEAESTKIWEDIVSWLKNNINVAKKN